MLPSGVRLEARHLAVGASCGRAQLEVYRRPRVAVLATGDELVEVDQLPRDYQIRNSNSYSLAAQIESAGGEADSLSHRSRHPRSDRRCHRRRYLLRERPRH